MRFVQYGNPGSKTVIFLHGGGLSTWNFRDEAEILQGRFHVLLPILDGHHGSDHKFTSIEENAARMIRYIDSRFQGKVFLIAGLSLGGQVLVEMLSQRNNICEFAMIESTLALPTKATAMLVGPVSVSYTHLDVYKRQCQVRSPSPEEVLAWPELVKYSTRSTVSGTGQFSAVFHFSCPKV